MRMIAGDINIYWQHETLTPYAVRGATYGVPANTASLLPDVGDVIKDFHGMMGNPTTVMVTRVEPLGEPDSLYGRARAYQVTVADVIA